MSSYRQKKDNFLYSLFQDMPMIGKYSMPIVKPINNASILNLLQFNYAKTCQNPNQYHLSFYIDDYQFERIWNEPVKSLFLLKNFKGLIGPDFSMYRDWPTILNIYNCPIFQRLADGQCTLLPVDRIPGQPDHFRSTQPSLQQQRILPVVVRSFCSFQKGCLFFHS